MNPANAINVVVTNTIIPTIPTTPTTNTTPVVFITPEVLQALQSYTLDNFPTIGLPKDIQEIAKNFLANLPPLTLITPTTAVPVTAAVPVTTTVTTPVTTTPAS